LRVCFSVLINILLDHGRERVRHRRQHWTGRSEVVNKKIREFGVWDVERKYTRVHTEGKRCNLELEDDYDTIMLKRACVRVWWPFDAKSNECQY